MDFSFMKFEPCKEASRNKDNTSEIQQKNSKIPEGYAVPEGYELIPKHRESKSKSLHILIYPSLYQRLCERATKEEISVNELISRLLHFALDNYDTLQNKS